MKIKVKGIAPYPGLRDLLLQVVGEDNRFEIDVEVADLEVALPIVLSAQEQNYDVIISRGGTASFIRKHVSIPVVDIPVSGYDILRVLTLIKDSNSKLAIIGFPNICQGALTVSSLLDFEIPIYSINHEAEVRVKLEKAVKEGAQIVLGDVVTVKTAQEMGLHGILITSGVESIQDMLSEVKSVHDIYLKSHEKALFFQHILQNFPTGTLVCDPKGKVLYLNDICQQLFGEVTMLPQDLSFLLKVTGIHSDKIHFEHVLIQKKSYNLKTVPYGEDVFIYIEPNKTPYMSELDMVQMPAQIASFAQIIGSSYVITKTIKRAIAYAKTDNHVWLSGEVGTGKAVFAEAIHSASSRNRGRFYHVACHSINESKLATELFGTDSKVGLLQIPSNDTLYLEYIENLSIQMQERLANELRKGTNLRVISSSKSTFKQLLKDPNIHQELIHLLGEYQLVIPPLRDRTEDIEEIARVLIANHNSIYGKQFVGIREEVLNRLMEYNWPGNLKELENIISELLALAKGHYIGIEEWDLVWERYSFTGVNSSAQRIDLNKTWVEIERQILEEVLKDEGMNQSKAAKRLGISRATLWRKMQ
ncbi:sigma-54-dependent Fis family transcriptional regulator [Gottfriedia solisilvae]|uniref:ArsR family transcriptional regulator n=1 Tax=Gottfriedia solisilvae TaxID=1516104 RepID=A0A8J3F140_9BACI|nr:PrpR N-terminal domain-containing protein [Gottfriedia solisilvae]GGI17002.1 ArsR family transcriptional regulator [Gottfriedia solisilvae]